MYIASPSSDPNHFRGITDGRLMYLKIYSHLQEKRLGENMFLNYSKRQISTVFADFELKVDVLGYLKHLRMLLITPILLICKSDDLECLSKSFKKLGDHFKKRPGSNLAFA